MRPDNLKTRLFLDGGDPEETRQIKAVLGFIDGQTTNPTLLSKNPAVQKRLQKGNFFREEEIFKNYRDIVEEISLLVPDGSISVEVNANQHTPAQEMLEQARVMYSWIPNAHIKFPIISEGLKAAEQAIKEGIRVNMTLCFTQEQAACVYSATKGAKKGDVFISPFLGRLDDLGFNGIELVQNIISMYQSGDGHVEVLAASIRNIDHLLMSMKIGADIVTCPFAILKQWADMGMPVPGEDYQYASQKLHAIPYKELNIDQPWQSVSFSHELIDKGVANFSRDWNKLTGKNQPSE